MEVEVLDPLMYFIGYLVVFVIYGGFMSLIALLIYNSFRSYWRYFRKIDDTINVNLSTLSGVEVLSISILCGAVALFLIWQWHTGIAWFAYMFGLLFSIAIPFVLLAYESKKTMTKVIKITLSVFLSLCILNLTHQDYLLIKYLALFSFIVLAYYSFQEEQKIAMILYVLLAMFFQPFIKIYIDKNIWNFIDVVVSAGLLLSLFVKPNKT